MTECRDEAPRTPPSRLPPPLFSFHLLSIDLLILFLLFLLFCLLVLHRPNVFLPSLPHFSHLHRCLPPFHFSLHSPLQTLPRLFFLFPIPLLFLLSLPSPLLHSIPHPLPLLNLPPLFPFFLSLPCLSLLLFINGWNVFAESRRKGLLTAATKELIGLMVDEREILSADVRLNSQRFRVDFFVLQKAGFSVCG